MWSCTFYLGNFLGPTLAGLAVENYGFRATTIGFFALDSGIILVDLFELYFSFKRSMLSKRIGEKTSYLKVNL